MNCWIYLTRRRLAMNCELSFLNADRVVVWNSRLLLSEVINEFETADWRRCYLELRQLTFEMLVRSQDSSYLKWKMNLRLIIFKAIGEIKIAHIWNDRWAWFVCAQDSSYLKWMVNSRLIVFKATAQIWNNRWARGVWAQDSS